MDQQIKLAVFADKEVGKKTIKYLLDNYPQDVALIVCVDENSVVYSELLQRKIDPSKIFFHSQLKENSVITTFIKADLDHILLAWWPYIIKEPILSITRRGILNFHPSYLPYNRGKHYNFWSILEDTPFGVTIHFINDKTDSGDIVFQKKIEKDWTDNGGTLYHKAQDAMVQLFCESYPNFRQGEYTRIQQNPEEGSFHLAKELEPASYINLNKEYQAKDLINLIRARTFPPHPAAWFVENDAKYEVRITINKV